MNAPLYDSKIHTLIGPQGRRTLTPAAHRLMQCLLESPNGVLIEQMIDAVWLGNTKPSTPDFSIRMHILRLQRKIAESGALVTIVNVQRGTGLYTLRKRSH